MVQTIDVIKGLKSGKPLSTPTAFKSAITWRNHQNQQYSVDFSFESTILNYYIDFFYCNVTVFKREVHNNYETENMEAIFYIKQLDSEFDF
jgi:hypothetical protein